MSDLPAIFHEDFNLYGCPHCGRRSRTPFNFETSPHCIQRCEQCKGMCVVVYYNSADWEEGNNPPPTHAGITLNGELLPMQSHPFSEGYPDQRPEDGGEYFSGRGIGGPDTNTKCFCCNEVPDHGLAAFVSCEAAGKRIVEMFPHGGVFLDFRPNTPHHVQVKVAACDRHGWCLGALMRLTHGSRTISRAKVRQLLN